MDEVKRCKEGLLKHYADKESKRFQQIDTHYLPDGGDGIMYPDEDGDCLTGCERAELMCGPNTVRVLIPITEGQNRERVIRGLEKTIKWLKRDSPGLPLTPKEEEKAEMRDNLIEECPKFGRCPINSCPLSFDYPYPPGGGPDQECTLPEEERVAILNKFGAELEYGGRTLKEHCARHG